MKKTTLQSILVIALLSLSFTVNGQTRYLDDIFSAVTVTSDVTYATNISILPMLQGLPPGPATLKCDIYEPTGDVLTNRPVIILVHTGSYLPPVINGKPTGSKLDLSIVEQCTRWAKKGYVAVAMDYRLGWNPTSTNQDVRTSSLLQAAYRGIQDAKAMVRYMRMTEATGNPYGIDESKIVLGGQGTGAYISLGYATLDNPGTELMLPKFINFNTTPPSPYVYPPFFGNPDGTDSTWLPAAASPTGQTELWNIPNNPSYSNDVNMVFTLGGALADISWLEAGEVPMVSFHCENDPYVPIDTGDVIVPTTGDFVVEVMGSRTVQHYANQYLNNDPFALTGISDVYTTAANINNSGYEGLNVFVTPPPSTTPNAFGELEEEQGSPWDWWDNASYDAMFQAVNGAPAGYGAANSLLGNPNMSATKGNLYLDTVQGYLNPRMYEVLSLNSSATPTWDCVNGACSDPGTGLGSYTTLSSCNIACGVTTFVSTTPENKKVVLENFTGGIQNYWAPSGDVIAQGLHDANPNDVFIINIHTGSFSNPNGPSEPDFNNPFGATIAGSSGLSGYPAGTVNRATFTGIPPQGSAGATALSRSDWAAASALVMAEPSILNVAAQANYDVLTGMLTVNTETYFTGSGIGGYTLHVAVVANNVSGPQAGAQSNNPGAIIPGPWTPTYNHQHMMVHLMDGASGLQYNNTSTGTFVSNIHTWSVPATLASGQSTNGYFPNLDPLNFDVVAYVIEDVGNTILTGFQTNVNLISDDIAAARLQGVGATVTITGVVTNGDELGLIRYIEDSTGGLALYDSALAGVVRGEEITVSGVLVDYNGLLEMAPVSTSITNNSGNSLTPQLITPIQIGEDTESELVQINNVIFNNGGSLFSEGTHDFTANNESGKVYIKAGNPLENSLIPVGIVTLVGISSQHTFSIPANDGYQIVPRDLADIIQIPNNVTSCFYTGDLNLISETVIGTTTYDLQSNASLQDRIIMHDDGTMSAVWTMSHELNTSFSDRGTGYNFFDGTSWGVNPTSRLESSRGGWPSIIAMGSGKEASVTHNTDNSHINMTHRGTTGAGNWTEQNISSIDSNGVPKYLIWNRSAVGGLNKETIHMVALTAPIFHGGTKFNGLDGALVYYRSQDEGVTWDIQDMQLPGMDTSMFDAMMSDSYTVTAQGETVVVAYFNDWGDSFIVKSTDNGTTWIKTTFLDFPVDKYTFDDGIDLDNNGILDKVYSTDNYGAVVLDSNGEAHVFYGVMMYADDNLTDGSSSWFPSTNGIAYWNEGMGEDVSLAISVNDIWYPNFNIISGASDLNGDGIVGGVDAIGGYALYYASRASMPSAGIDSLGNLYVSFSAYTETADNGSQVFRHINIVKSEDGGGSWSCPVDVTPNPSWMGMKECVFGSMNKVVDDKIRIVYQQDNEPGLAVRGDLDLVDYNDIVYLEISVSIFDTNSYISGCTDSLADNFDALATLDDGSCTYCNISNSISIINPTNLSACDGWAVSNSVSNYPIISYNWFNSQGVNVSSSNFAMNLCNDIYIISIIDSAGCQFSDTIIVGVPSVSGCIDSLAYNYDSTANTDDGSCLYCDLTNAFMIVQNTPNNCNGLILANTSSSNLPVSYLWSTGSAVNNISGLCSGTYSLNITDAVGCTIDTSVTIGQVLVYGCTDPLATNYYAGANIDDGSCTYAPSLCANPSPANAYVNELIHDRARVNWDNMNDANCMVNQYRIRYREIGSSSWSSKTMSGSGLCMFGLNTTSKKILGLTASTTYEYYMKAWYCGGGVSGWSAIQSFTTLDLCPNVVNFAVSTPTNTKASFTWDTISAYSFARIKLRPDVTGGVWTTAGGFGVFYPALTKNKNGLTPGQTYRASVRAWCDPTGGTYRADSWTAPIFWTQPTSVKLAGESLIENLAIYPNPSRDIFNLSFTSDAKQDLSFRIMNVIGEELINENLPEFIGEYTKQINLTNNAKGIYFLEIETNDGIINKKLILQ